MFPTGPAPAGYNIGGPQGMPPMAPLNTFTDPYSSSIMSQAGYDPSGEYNIASRLCCMRAKI